MQLSPINDNHALQLNALNFIYILNTARQFADNSGTRLTLSRSKCCYRRPEDGHLSLGPKNLENFDQI